MARTTASRRRRKGFYKHLARAEQAIAAQALMDRLDKGQPKVVDPTHQPSSRDGIARGPLPGLQARVFRNTVHTPDGTMTDAELRAWQRRCEVFPEVGPRCRVIVKGMLFTGNGVYKGKVKE